MTSSLKNIIIAVLVVGVIWLLLIRHCGNKPTEVVIPDTTASLDSVAKVKYADSMWLVWQKDSIQGLKDLAEEYWKAAEGKQRDAESSATFWAMKYRLAKRDSLSTIIEPCDSLESIVGQLTQANSSLRGLQAERDKLHAHEIAIRDTAVADCDLAYLSAVDAAVKSNEAFSAYREQNKPRVQFYVGLAGSYNPHISSGGPVIGIRGKKGLMVMGGYQVGNGKPTYTGGFMVPIKLRRR